MSQKGSLAATVCDENSGRVQPVIARNKCEGAGDCLAVCPFDVFTVRNLDAGELHSLSWPAWIKVKVHGGRQAFVVQGDACHACGLCVSACPEHAIHLINPDREGNDT